MIFAELTWQDPIEWSSLPAQETILLVMRHGETYGNNRSDETTYIYTGCQTDFPLNENGLKQAASAAAAFRKCSLPIAGIYASPLTRAQQTAAATADFYGLDVQPCPELREINWGIADGKLVKEMSSQWSAEEKRIIGKFSDLRERWDHLPVFPDAEKFNAVLARVKPELIRIAEACQGKIVLVVTHGRVIKCLLEEIQNTSVPYPNNCGVAVFRYSSHSDDLKLIEIRN